MHLRILGVTKNHSCPLCCLVLMRDLLEAAKTSETPVAVSLGNPKHLLYKVKRLTLQYQGVYVNGALDAQQ
jgi:hypothetical protein